MEWTWRRLALTSLPIAQRVSCSECRGFALSSRAKRNCLSVDTKRDEASRRLPVVCAIGYRFLRRDTADSHKITSPGHEAGGGRYGQAQQPSRTTSPRARRPLYQVYIVWVLLSSRRGSLTRLRTCFGPADACAYPVLAAVGQFSGDIPVQSQNGKHGHLCSAAGPAQHHMVDRLTVVNATCGRKRPT